MAGTNYSFSMPSRVDSRVKELAVRAYASGGSLREVSKRFSIARETLSRALSNFAEFGTIDVPNPPKRTGRMEKIHAIPSEFMKSLIDKHPTIYLKELAWRLKNELVMSVSPPTISRHLKKMKITRKQTSVQAKQRSIWLRGAYLNEIGQYSPEQLCFCDESAVTEKSTRRRWAWANSGRRAVVQYDYGRAERWSLLPLLSIQGFLTVEAIQGAYNAESFEDWIYQSALPVMNRYPLPNSVLVMDNAPIHVEDRLRAMCSEFGVRLVMLPPYSPDFNPIELAFGIIKRYLQEHYEGSSTANLPAAMLAAARHAITPHIASQIYCGSNYIYADSAAAAEGDENWARLVSQMTG